MLKPEPSHRCIERTKGKRLADGPNQGAAWKHRPAAGRGHQVSGVLQLSTGGGVFCAASRNWGEGYVV
jgi:hypothetical protein